MRGGEAEVHRDLSKHGFVTSLSTNIDESLILTNQGYTGLSFLLHSHLYTALIRSA